MKKSTLYPMALVISILLLIAIVYMIFIGRISDSGWLFLGFFLTLAFGFSGYKSVKGFVFAILIFAGISISLYYPDFFTEMGSLKLTVLIIPLIQIIMFGMGTTMSIKDFATVFESPKGVLIGVSAQLVIMPIIGFLLATTSNFSPEIAAGIILIGCSLSGVASNVMAYLAKANVALSITITSIATLLAPFVTPILMKLLAGQFVEIDILSMMWTIIKMIIIPIGAGLLCNRFLARGTQWINRVMPLTSMFAIGLIIIIINAAGRDSLLEIGVSLMFFVLIHNLAGYSIGYGYALIFGLSERDARTIALKVGMQNGGMASGLANALGKITTMGLAPAVFGPLMNITGSILASYWQDRPTIEKSKSEISRRNSKNKTAQGL